MFSSGELNLVWSEVSFFPLTSEKSEIKWKYLPMKCLMTGELSTMWVFTQEYSSISIQKKFGSAEQGDNFSTMWIKVGISLTLRKMWISWFWKFSGKGVYQSIFVCKFHKDPFISSRRTDLFSIGEIGFRIHHWGSELIIVDCLISYGVFADGAQ